MNIPTSAWYCGVSWGFVDFQYHDSSEQMYVETVACYFKLPESWFNLKLMIISKL